FVQPGWSILIGTIATCIVYVLLLLKKYMRFDDTLDVAIVHGCGGIAGAFMTGLFSQKWVNEAGGFDGAFYGRPVQLWYQIAGILTAIGFAAACTAGILLPLHWTIGIRLPPSDEIEGLDVTAHGESWEVAASRAFSRLVKQMLEDHNNNVNSDDVRQNGIFALQYTSGDRSQPSVTIPFPTPKLEHHHLSNDFLSTGKQQSPNCGDAIRF
ncbi:unnamed protein product, partial [Adineta ricciae]